MPSLGYFLLPCAFFKTGQSRALRGHLYEVSVAVPLGVSSKGLWLPQRKPYRNSAMILMVETEKGLDSSQATGGCCSKKLEAQSRVKSAGGKVTSELSDQGPSAHLAITHRPHCAQLTASCRLERL